MHDSAAPPRFYEDYVSRSAGGFLEQRLAKVCAHIRPDVTSLLDVGAGKGRNLQLFASRFPGVRLYGTDIAQEGVDELRAQGFEGVACDASRSIPYEGAFFDVVVCGEVIEHVVDTDGLLTEIRRVLKPTGTLILTTPNLAYMPNRLMLLCGLQPLFTETSLRYNLGRRFRALGQGGPTQGHLKVFTAPALRDLLRSCDFDIRSFEGYSFLTAGVLGRIDHLLSHIPSLAAGFVVAATLKTSP